MYPKNITRTGITKRFIACIFIAAIIGWSAGTATGYYTGKEEAADEAAVYGAYDNKTIDKEPSLNWETDDSFKPLDIPLDEDIQEFTYYLCAAYNMDNNLILAMIQVESDNKADAVSSTNDYGLMQINQSNHKWLTEAIGVTDYLDPYQNIRAGCYILRKLFEKYQTPDMVLMAYHMGEKGARSLWQQGIYSTSYTDEVLKCQRELEEGVG